MLMNEVMFQPDRWKSVAVCVRWTMWMHDGGEYNLFSLSLSLSLCSLVLSPKLLKVFQLNLVFCICTTTGVTGIRLFHNRLTVCKAKV
jgi:hypothetical protein